MLLDGLVAVLPKEPVTGPPKRVKAAQEQSHLPMFRLDHASIPHYTTSGS